ncbi:MAG: hypothetical protein J6T80_07635 [Paludibacteraceae bacterium]|nr:hypothetical protein [Paludibacteraceae bacterium]
MQNHFFAPTKYLANILTFTLIYHCRNSLFTFKVEVHARILFWYDENTPIFKE